MSRVVGVWAAILITGCKGWYWGSGSGDALDGLDAGMADAGPPSCDDSTTTDVITLSPDIQGVQFVAQIISPDSKRVLLFGAPAANGSATRLFSVPICGGHGAEIGTDLPVDPDASFLSAWFTADSSRVVYVRAHGQDARLYTVSAAGGESRQLSPPPDGLLDLAVFDAKLVPNGTAVFEASNDRGEATRLYSVPADGSSDPVLLAETTAGQLYDFELTGDGENVVFAGDMLGDGAIGVYSVPTSGGSTTLLTPTAPGAPGPSRFFGLAANGVLFTGSLDAPTPNRGYSTPVTGGALTEIGTMEEPFLFLHDVPGTDDVVFATTHGDGIRRLYRATVGVPGMTLLSGTGGFAADAYEIGKFDYGVQLSSDAGRIVYLDDRDTAWVTELYSASIAGGDVQRLSLPSTDSMQGAGIFSPIPATGDVAFLSNVGHQDQFRLYRVPETGGDIVQIAPSADDPDSSVSNFRASSDGAWIVYACQCDALSGRQLLKIRPDGTDRTPIFMDAMGTNTQGYSLSPDGAWVVWLGSSHSDRNMRIRSRHSDGLSGPKTSALAAIKEPRCDRPGFSSHAGPDFRAMVRSW